MFVVLTWRTSHSPFFYAKDIALRHATSRAYQSCASSLQPFRPLCPKRKTTNRAMSMLVSRSRRRRKLSLICVGLSLSATTTITAFAPANVDTRRLGRLSVMTEPPRTNRVADYDKDDDDDEDNEAPPGSDYLLQTEDFSRELKAVSTHQFPHAELTEAEYSQLEELLEHGDQREDNSDLERKSFLPWRMANPGVSWKHYMHATGKFISRHRNQRHAGPIDYMRNIITRPQLVSECSEWKRLQKHAEYIRTTHLKDLLQDQARSDSMWATHDGVYLDYSRQRVTTETMKFLYALAEKQDLKGKIQEMVSGTKINFTEDRAVLHTALRADRSEAGTVMVDGQDVIEEVHEVLDQIKAFTEGVRSGKILGYTGKPLRNIVSVGIGGSFLGPEFLHECLKTEPEGIHNSLGYNLRFLSNVDPVDVERTCADLDPEETLVVVVSKTFTTAETMLNARTMRQWLWDFMGNDEDVVKKHMVACASISAMQNVEEFGIDTEKYFFKFWDFVGGRYSVCSAAGAVPISLLYGFDLFEKFLKGANSIDKHFVSAPLDKNIPVLMGLIGVWNRSFLKYRSRTTLPYAEALLKLPAHIQQLDMESNGKKMTIHGLEADYPVGEIDFGEAGTNGQHSFYQLLHMGQTVPSEFIGFVQSQHDYKLDGESLSSHDELMANFFAQPDALATGKTPEEVRAEGVAPGLVGHKVFKGNRPSLSLLLPKLTAYACGQLLALYEHRTAVQGFIWDINSFDQWGVELGKKLAIDVKDHLEKARSSHEAVETANPATTRLLNYYVENSRDCGENDEGNPITCVTRQTHREHNGKT